MQEHPTDSGATINNLSISSDNFIYLYIDNFVDFPKFNGKSNEYADFDNKIGFIVENVEQDDKRLKDVEED